MTSVAHIIRRRRQRRSRKREARMRSRQWSFLIGLSIFLLLIVPVGVVLGGAGYLYWRVSAELPRPADTTYSDPVIGPTEFYDRGETVLLYSVTDPLSDQRRWLSLDDLPQSVIDATLLMEDADFLQTAHFDAAVALNRLWQYMLGVPLGGDRSLTGRLVRNAVLPIARQSGLDDPLLEIVLGAEINRQYSPEEVLEWHLNTNFYGHDAYGIDAAAQVYLGKSAAQLTLDEVALLAAIPPSPQYSPFDNETAARGRQADLLRTMLARGMISQADFDTAIARTTPLQVDLAQRPELAPEFAVYARRQTEAILNSLGMDGARMVSRGGLRVVTTLDLDLYAQANCVMQAHFTRLTGSTGIPPNCPAAEGNYLPPPGFFNGASVPDEGALVMIDARNGQILTMNGPADQPDFQPGPTLHPFVYFEGFISRLFTPATMVLDIPRPFPGPAEGLIYTPVNRDGQFRGPMNLRDAMSSGLLPPVYHVAETQGMRNVLVKAHKIGLNSLDENLYDLSLLERGGNVSVLDISYAYSVFAAMGVMHGVEAGQADPNYRFRDPVAVLRIEDSTGALLWEYDETQVALSQTAIFEDSLAYLINDILSDASTRRAVLSIDDQNINPGRPAAVVNGMTSNNESSWTVGYTPQLVVGVHVGRADHAAMTLDPHGLQGAAPIWRAMLSYTLDRSGAAPIGWDQPQSVAEYVVCERSGMQPGAGKCPTRVEIFPRDAQIQIDTTWQTYIVNRETRQLATASTPANQREELSYFIPPSEAQDWWVSNGQPLPPTTYDSVSLPEVFKRVQILQPRDLSYIGGEVDIRGSVDSAGLRYFQLDYGQGIDPQQWFAISGQQSVFSPGTSLGIWSTAGLEGAYTLRLTAIYEDEQVDYAFVQLSVDNVPPTVSLQAGEPGQSFSFPSTEIIPVVATVSDNFGIDRVEFYQNGLSIGIDDEWPYGFEFDVNRTGLEIFKAVAYDQVGNRSENELQIEITRSGG